MDAEALRSCTKPQLEAFWAEYLQAGGPQRRKLSSQVFAAQHALPPAPAGVRCIDGREGVLAFKRTLYAFPAPCAPPEDAPPAPEAAARANGTGRGADN